MTETTINISDEAAKVANSFTDEEIAAVRKFMNIALAPFVEEGPDGTLEPNRLAMLQILEFAAPYTAHANRVYSQPYLQGAIAAFDYMYRLLNGIEGTKATEKAVALLVSEIENAMEQILMLVQGQ